LFYEKSILGRGVYKLKQEYSFDGKLFRRISGKPIVFGEAAFLDK
jgi:hypothetical protein